MKIIYIALLFMSLSMTSFGQNFKNSFWGDSREKVKSNEKMFLVKEEKSGNNLDKITFIEDLPDGIYYLHTYMFLHNKLYGVKSKKVNLDGDNSLYKAIDEYNALLSDYKNNFEESISEKTHDPSHDLKGFQFKEKDLTHFVSLRKEDGDYFIVQTVFHNE